MHNLHKSLWSPYDCSKSTRHKKIYPYLAFIYYTGHNWHLSEPTDHCAVSLKFNRNLFQSFSPETQFIVIFLSSCTYRRLHWHFQRCQYYFNRVAFVVQCFCFYNVQLIFGSSPQSNLWSKEQRTLRVFPNILSSFKLYSLLCISKDWSLYCCPLIIQLHSSSSQYHLSP